MLILQCIEPWRDGAFQVLEGSWRQEYPQKCSWRYRPFRSKSSMVIWEPRFSWDGNWYASFWQQQALVSFWPLLRISWERISCCLDLRRPLAYQPSAQQHRPLPCWKRLAWQRLELVPRLELVVLSIRKKTGENAFEMSCHDFILILNTQL